MKIETLRKSTLFSFLKSNPKITILMSAAAALSSASTLWASTDSWIQQPVWASSPSEGQRRAAVRDQQRETNVEPFAPGSNNVALDVGQVFLMGDMGSHYSDAIGAQLHYTYGVSDLFGFDSSLGYSDHSDGAFSMTTLLTGLRTNLAWYDKVVPYMIVGLGFYRPSFSIAAIPGSNVEATTIAPILFGVHAGAGVDLELTKKLYFGAALTLHDVFGNTTTTTTPSGSPLPVGGTYISFLLHIGTTF